MIQLKNVSKVYTKDNKIRVNALMSVSFEIARGEFTVIKGASGSGKTTLMNVIGFLDRPSAGEYYFDDKNVVNLSDKEISKMRNDKVGFVFQSFNLIKRKSSIENVMLPLFYSDRFSLDYKRVSIEKLKAVGLKRRLGHMPSELSGGEQQRVAIARALINDPELILADEPTGNLDSKTAEDIMEIFKKLNSEGKTIVIVTHEDFISNYAKRIITLKDGSILTDKTGL